MSPDDPLRFIRAATIPREASLVPEIRLYQAETLIDLWQALEEASGGIGTPPPYWAFAWPGSQAIARLLLDEPRHAQGRRVFDFAAGAGTAAIAAAMAGAQVSANDIDPYALAAIGLNAALNGVGVTLASGDVVGTELAGFDLILAGDVCYEREMSARAIPWLRQLVAHGREVWLADPGRTYRPQDGLVRLAEYRVPVLPDVESCEFRDTIVWQLTA